MASQHTLYHGTGCEKCFQTGMRGRLGLFEFLHVNDELRKVISQNPSVDAIADATDEGHVTLREDGVQKILKGETTLEEVFRVTQD